MERLGVRWIVPDIQVAHPLDDGRAAALRRSLDATCARLGPDGDVWRRAVGRVVEGWDGLAHALMKPLLTRPFPSIALAPGLLPASVFAKRFRSEPARALFAGLAAHGMRPMGAPATAAFGIVLGALAHVGGWPPAEGGSSAITEALAAHLESLGGAVRTGHRVRRPGDLPPSRVVLFDTHPAALSDVYGDRLPSSARRRITRYRGGAAAYKIDYALDGPIPWSAPECTRAGVVHVGGAYREVADAALAVEAGRRSRTAIRIGRPAEPLRPDQGPGREAHRLDLHPCTRRIPRADAGPDRGADRAFRPRIPGPGAGLPRHPPRRISRPTTPTTQEGTSAPAPHTLRRMLGRPGPFLNPYRTGIPGVYLCSAAAPPGPGVHGMCGAGAAAAVLRDSFGPM